MVSFLEHHMKKENLAALHRSTTAKRHKTKTVNLVIIA